MNLDGSTQIVGVFGSPIAHTASPAMHNAAFATLGIPGRYVVLPTMEHELETLLQVAVYGAVVLVAINVLPL